MRLNGIGVKGKTNGSQNANKPGPKPGNQGHTAAVFEMESLAHPIPSLHTIIPGPLLKKTAHL